MAADAVRYVATTEDKFDVVIADLFHPAWDGAANLYTAEHFERIKGRLNSDGLFCQWLPLYQLDMNTLKIIMRTFLSIYPHARLFLDHFGVDTPVLGLVGGPSRQRFSPDWYETRVDKALAASLNTVRLTSGYELFGLYAGGPFESAQFAGEGPINTEDRPTILF